MVNPRQDPHGNGFTGCLEDGRKFTGVKHFIILTGEHSKRLPDRTDVSLVIALGPKFSARENEYCGVRKPLASSASANLVTGRSLNARIPKPLSTEIAMIRGTPTLTHPPLPGRDVAASRLMKGESRR